MKCKSQEHQTKSSRYRIYSLNQSCLAVFTGLFHQALLASRLVRSTMRSKRLHKRSSTMSSPANKRSLPVFKQCIINLPWCAIFARPLAYSLWSTNARNSCWATRLNQLLPTITTKPKMRLQQRTKTKERRLTRHNNRVSNCLPNRIFSVIINTCRSRPVT